MPKEYVGTAPQEWGSVTVRWGRDDGTVQVSVAGPIGWRDSLRHDPAVDPDNGLDWHFTARERSEINHMIRLLRRARDAAFGADA